MSDNTVLNPGVGGDTVRTEDVGGGVKVPVYKLHTGANGADGGSVTATNPLPAKVVDAAGAQVGAVQSAANVTTLKTPSPLAGIGLVAAPAGWVSNNVPSTATQATVTLAAAASGVRHVCHGVTFAIATGATAQTPIQCYVRDGATGAGAVLWAGTLACPANSSASITAVGLELAGTAATGMTFEFSAAGVTASQQTVAATGYDVA